ncbi:hypothetical protein LB465_16760 [Salegentibacter sp. LM13S]|uniref:hypothetical protein n=1 Tax=Salegentibacter lacus TaxID=2873599 RepID=UPI001CCB61CF|nr:hypothetical protein [Salegentibacter lacus]MBZ9632435.1 hypothetical protein [Salegentibacter lacus]
MKVLLFTTIFIAICCSQEEKELNSTCYQNENRKVEKEILNHKGIIIAPDESSCPSLYTIKDETENQILNLAPCELPDKFKMNEMKVIFSGSLYETFETEDICALPIELSNIQEDE